MSDNPLPGQMGLFGRLDLKPDKSRLDQLAKAVGVCRRCSLCSPSRKPVFGSGEWASPVIAVLRETPFGSTQGAFDPEGSVVSDQEKLRFDIELSRIHIKSKMLYFASAVCGIGRLDQNSISSCREWWVSQFRCVQPKTILTVGRVSIASMFDVSPVGIDHRFGRWDEWQGIPVFHFRDMYESPYAWDAFCVGLKTKM